MAIEPIFERINLSGKRRLESEPIKAECKTGVMTDGVSEVLSVSAFAVTLNNGMDDGKISCDGRAVFYVCYLTAEGEIKKTECSADFSGSIKDNRIKSGNKAICRAEVVKTEHDLTGSSLSVSAVIRICAELNENVEINALSGGDNLVIDTKEIRLSKSYGVREGVYPLEEEFELACEIKEVINHRASASITSVSSGVGSIIVDGQVYLTVIALQKSEKCSIIKEVRNLPFRMEIECEDAMPTMQATASVVEKSIKTQVLVDEENGKSKVTVSLSLHFTGEAWSSEERTVARDSFSTTDDIELIKEQADCYKPCVPEFCSSSFNGRAGVSELPVGVVLFAVGNEKAELLSSEISDGKLKLNGVITAIGYFCDGEGKPFTRKLETTFEKELDCSASGEKDIIIVKAEKVSARLISAVEVELDGELLFGVYTRELDTFSCIKEIKSVGEKQENPHAISVYIPLEDEELWSLSKRLNVCPTTLVETNPELTFPLTGKERIVVYRKK